MLRPIYIQMHQNPIDCNCDINWLIEKIRSKLLRFIGFCENPNILRNLIIDGSIQPYLGKCNQSMMNQVSHRLDDSESHFVLTKFKIISY